MYKPQHLVDLQGKSTDFGGGGDPKSWLLSNNNNSSPRTHSQLNNSSATNANLDRVLFNDLVEMVPLVQSLIDRKVSSSFTRRGSMIYTKTPSRDSLSKKVIDPRGRNAAQSIPTKRKNDHVEKDQGKAASSHQDDDSFSIISSKAMIAEKDLEELVALREQVEDLQRKLLEKDELLKSAEVSKNQTNVIQAKFDELRLQVAEKDSLIKSTQQQLSDAKIKLADKQAALEKLRWEAMTSNQKVDKLQEELDSIQGGVSSFMVLFEGMTKNDSTACAEDYDIRPYLNQHNDIDDWDEMEMQKMEEARQAYIAAVAAAKEKRDEESIAAAANARVYLQSFVLKSNNTNNGRVLSNGGFSQVSYGAFSL